MGRRSALARHQGIRDPRAVRRGGRGAGARLDWVALLGLARATYARTGVWMDDLSLQQVLEVVGDFDQSGGANVSLAAWELFGSR